MYNILTFARLKDSRGKYFAEIQVTDKVMSYHKIIDSKSIDFQCPHCHFTTYVRDSVGLQVMQFDNLNIGDFTINDSDIKYVLIVSERALEIMKQFKGLKSFVKLDIAFYRGKEIEGANLYLIEPEYSTAILSRKKSGLKPPRTKKTRKKCPVCNPDGYSYMSFDRIFLENKNDDLDFFITYDSPSFVFFSDELLKSLKENGMTNIVERCIPSEKYISYIMEEEREAED
ncbi:MAG: hypothetical protein AB7U79_08740 [Candidatus Izemoplasmatales bacterium]